MRTVSCKAQWRAQSAPDRGSRGAILAYPLKLGLFALFYSAAAIGCPDNADAQANSKPILTLGAQSPASEITDLALSEDGEQLFAGGFDKAIYQWRCSAKGAFPAIPAQSHRWQKFRGANGVIRCVEYESKSNRLAYAGWGSKDLGAILVVDTLTGDIERYLIADSNATVSDLAFSPNGRRLAAVTATGAVVVWDVANWQRRLLATAAESRNPYGYQLVFAGENAIVANDAAGGAVTLDISSGRQLSRENETAILALGSNAKNEWVCSNTKGRLVHWSQGRRTVLNQSAPKKAYVSLALSNEGLLFAFASPTQRSPSANVEVWDVRKRLRLDVQAIARPTVVRTPCAVAASGDVFVIFDSRNSMLLSYRLRDANGQLRARPLSDTTPTRIPLSGLSPKSIRFDAAADYRLYIDTDFGPKTFDLAETKLRPASRMPAKSLRQYANFSVDRVDGGVRINEQGQARWTISLDPKWQGRMQASQFLGPSEKPYAIAVSDRQSRGVFVYSLPVAGQPELLRYFRAHQGPADGLAVSADSRYLVSASSLDKVVRIWSLAGIRSESLISRWGCRFQRIGDHLRVDNVHPNGIAGKRGLQEGDVIGRVECFREQDIIRETSPAKMLAVLSKMPWHTFKLAILPHDKKQGRVVGLVPGWEPLASLFIDRGGEWAYWTPRGFYNASPLGDELFGWQLNHGKQQQPQFFRADQFREDLERPELMRKLISFGNLRDALAGAEPSPKRAISEVKQLAEFNPTVRIVSPKRGENLSSERADIEAEIIMPAGAGSEMEVDCYVNGAPLGDPVSVRSSPRDLGGTSARFRWRLSLAVPIGRIRVKAFASGSKGGRFASADVIVRRAAIIERRPTKRRLHLLSLAVGDYGGENDLPYPVDDADALVSTLQDRCRELYDWDAGVRVALRNAEVTPSNVDDAISRLRNQLQNVDANDVLIVFLAGHGVGFEREYYFLPTTRVFRDFNNPSVARKHAVPWAVFRRLTSIRCRKIFFLDTCHSGNIVAAEEDPSEQWKHRVRPLRRSECLVLSATSDGELAWPLPDKGHGAFTYCLLQALRGNADGRQSTNESPRDGSVDLEELIGYVRSEVPRVAPAMQQPSSTSNELGFLPLTTYSR